MSDPKAVTVVDQTLCNRKTVKVLSDVPVETTLDRSTIEALLTAAGWAPFHRPAARKYQAHGQLQSKVPWRFYLLDGPDCRSLREQFLSSGDTTKVPRMLASASTLILVTWLPHPPETSVDQLFDGSLENMEHIAAASAAIQNLLIAATARDIPSYWSSGGGLRKPETMARLGIPEGEVLLGAIFLFPEDLEGFEVSAGKLRDQRGTPDTWSRWVKVDEK